MRLNMFPDLIVRPCGKRVELDHLIGIIPFHKPGVGAEGRLVTAQSDLLTIIHQVDPMYVIVSAPESFLLKRRRDVAAKVVQPARRPPARPAPRAAAAKVVQAEPPAAAARRRTSPG